MDTEKPMLSTALNSNDTVKLNIESIRSLIVREKYHIYRANALLYENLNEAKYRDIPR